MKAMKGFISLVLGTCFVLSGCSVLDSFGKQTSTTENSGSLKEENISSDSEPAIPMHAGQYVCYSVATAHDSDGATFVGEEIGNGKVLKETDYVLDLKADNTFILRYDYSRMYTALYGSWEGNEKTIALTAVTGEEYTVQVDGEYLEANFGYSVKLSKKANAVHIAQDAVEGVYTFISASVETPEGVVSIKFGDTYTDRNGNTAKYTEATLLVDLQANGKAFFMGDRTFGISGGYYGVWVQEGDKITLTLDELEWVYTFTLQGNRLIVNTAGDDEGGQPMEIILEK